MLITFEGEHVIPEHSHDYRSICCTAPIMEGSEMYAWDAQAEKNSGYCSACQDHVMFECLYCQEESE